ncbi:hypothetical protein JCM8115_006696 [Rhodotorula mucilaginosa]|uniref:SRP9 domain-containing protein n=1 Tax=Rhodotorula mucilaginosa TaxID=5537 RepID=A0A9P6W711_RHOMI|nr:hypothetical protein C6P46_004978 [Rhodotorula mucilaginosa]
MLYRSWDSFTQACITLCDQSERPTRTCIRWRHQLGLLVIKVTDDKQTLTFKTRSGVYLNRFDSLNRQLLRKYANKRRAAVPAVVEVAGPAEDVKMVEERGEEGALAAEDGTPAQGTSSSKKKKSKGKKKNK